VRLVKRTTKRKGKKNGTKNRMGGERLVFFKICTYFLLTQVMKSTHICKRWKKGRFISTGAKS
jgi:hypothetical protein